MKFELYDDIKLNKEVEALAACGIHKGCYGTVTRIEGGKSLVLFYNSEDTGDSAWAWTENENLEFYQKWPGRATQKFAEWVATQDPAKKPRFREKRLQELDNVKVLAEKPEYAKNGVHKGMEGTILDPRKIGGKWLVFFPDETGADTVESPISETDLELVFRLGEKKD